MPDDYYSDRGLDPGAITDAMPHRLTALLAVLLTAQPLRGQDSVPPAPMAPTAPGPVSVPVTLPVVPAPRAPTVAAPEPPVFTSLEVDAPPVLDSVQTWYFPKGKLDRSARVVFQAIVDTSGRIEPATIRLVSTTDSSFVPAARLTLMVSYYRPATARGERVRVLVQQALRYRKNAGRSCELDAITPMLPPRC